MATPTQITVGTNTYALVPTPTSPGPKSVSFTMLDTVAASSSPFTLQTQVQSFPGADRWQIDVTLPPMNREQAGPWIAFLASLRGQQNVFQIGDPAATHPSGNPQGIPVVDGSVATNNAATTTVLFTKGWKSNAHRLLLPYTFLQIGYRLYMCLDVVDSDATGAAPINIFPSIREVPADGAAITLVNTKGLFRLVDNTRKWNMDVASLFGISFSCVEVR